MTRILVSAKNLESGIKRVNLTLTIREYEDLIEYSEYMVTAPTVTAHSLLVRSLRKEIAIIRKSGLSRQTNLFDSKKKKGRKNV